MEAGPDTARVNEYLFRIQQLDRSSNPHILHFDCTVGDLRAWFWPITNAGHRVTPEDLATYRASGFRRPCCLCAVPKLGGVSSGYSESTVILAVGGENPGIFVLTCAENNCAYQVPIDRAYVSPGLPLKRYTRLNAGTRYTRVRAALGQHNHPSNMEYFSDLPGLANNMLVGPAQPSRANENILRSLARGIRRSAPLAVQDSPVSKLIRLNSFIFPGLPEEEFEALFTRCRECSWIMTRRAFNYHSCQPVVPTAQVIDLTMDNDEDIIDLTVDSDEEVMDLTMDSDEEAMDLTMDSDEEIIDLTMGGDEEF